jgi:hypothetical protein
MQTGNENFDAATPIDQTFTVTTVTAIEVGELNSPICCYPNPTTAYLNIELSSFENSNTKIELISQTGKVVKTVGHDASATDIRLDMQSLQPGLYILKITNNDSRQEYRIIKN